MDRPTDRKILSVWQLFAQADIVYIFFMFFLTLASDISNVFKEKILCSEHIQDGNSDLLEQFVEGK